MSGFEPWLGAFLAITVVAFLVRHLAWRVRDLPVLDQGALLGRMKDWEIRVVDDPNGGRSVGIAIERHNADGPNERFYAVLSPAQARQLAQWLRVAAAPGRTLAEARLNLRKSLDAHGSAIMRDRSAGPG